MREQEQLHYHRCSIFVDNLFLDQLSRCRSIEYDSDRWYFINTQEGIFKQCLILVIDN